MKNARLFSRIAVVALAATVLIPTSAMLSTTQAQAASNTQYTDSFDIKRTFTVSSNTVSQLQYIPIPVGLTPTEISGVIFPEAQVNGRVLFLSNNRTVATFPVTPETEALEVSFPVSESDVDENDYLVFGMRFLTDSVTEEEHICVISDFGTVSFEEVVVHVTGTEAPPSTIAQFFSNSVRKIAVTIPEDPEPELQQAGLQAVAALSYRYPTLETDISLTTLNHADRAVDVEEIGGRLVNIVPGNGEVIASVGLRDGMRELTLSGDPSKLASAAAALGSPKLALVDASETTELTLEANETATPALTLTQLGTNAISLGGIGTSVQQVNISQTQFGLPVQSFKLHLEGVRSQVPDNVSAMLSIYWNGDLLSSQVFDENTTIDLDLSVADTRVERNNVLNFRMDAIPNGGGGGGDSSGSSTGLDCGGTFAVLPIEVFIDGEASTVTATPGQSLKPGFARMPQVFNDVLPLAISSNTLLSDSISDAAEILIALQRAATNQITVRMMPAPDFINSSVSGLIVGASTEEIDQLRAPLRMAEFRQIDSDGAVFSAGVLDSYAALQAFRTGEREILSLSSWGPYQPGSTVGHLLQTQISNYISESEFGWNGLYNDLLIAQLTYKEPIILDSDTVVPQPERISDANTTLVWVGVGIGSLLLFALLGWMSRRHLRRRARKYIDAEELYRQEVGAATASTARYSDSSAPAHGMQEVESPIVASTSQQQTPAPPQQTPGVWQSANLDEGTDYR